MGFEEVESSASISPVEGVRKHKKKVIFCRVSNGERGYKLPRYLFIRPFIGVITPFITGSTSLTLLGLKGFQFEG